MRDTKNDNGNADAPPAESERDVRQVGLGRVAVGARVAVGDEAFGAVVGRGVLKDCPVSLIKPSQGIEDTERMGRTTCSP